jgi:hypothetical protein
MHREIFELNLKSHQACEIGTRTHGLEQNNEFKPEHSGKNRPCCNGGDTRESLFLLLMT